MATDPSLRERRRRAPVARTFFAACCCRRVEAPLVRLLGHRHGNSPARQRYAQTLQNDVADVAGLIAAFSRAPRG